MLLGLLLGVFALFGAFAVDINLDKIEVNGYSAVGGTPLYIERSNKLDIDLWFTSAVDYSDVQVYAFIAGYEYGEIRDYSDVFDIKAGVMYHKTLEIQLPEILDTGSYKLRIVFADKDGQLETYDIELVVGTARHDLEIRNIMVIPGKIVKQGDAMLVAARIENMGEKDERDVKVTVEVPELGLKQVDYVDLIEAGEVLSTDYLMLNIPECANVGEFTLKVTVSYNRDTKEAVKTEKFNVIESGACVQAPSETTQKKTLITLGPKTAMISKGEKATYVVTIRNAGSTDALYNLEAVVPGNWAEVSFAPAKTFVLKSGEEKLVYVTVKPKANVEGEQMFKLVLKVNNEEAKEIPLTAVISGSNTKNVLELTIVVLIIVLILLGIIIGAVKAKKKTKEEEEETYY